MFSPLVKRLSRNACRPLMRTRSTSTWGFPALPCRAFFAAASRLLHDLCHPACWVASFVTDSESAGLLDDAAQGCAKSNFEPLPNCRRIYPEAVGRRWIYFASLGLIDY